MTPPPTSIDGTDITGATIDGQQVQEITIDGQTVFTALPDPAIHQWKWDEGSGTSFSDSIGSASGTFTFDNYVTGNFTGGTAVATDGVDDFGSTDSNLAWLDGLVSSGWAFAYTLDDFTETDRNDFVGVQNQGSDFFLIANGANNSGDVRVGLREDGDQNWAFRTTSGGHVNDGNKHRVLINKIGPCSNNNLEIYVDNTSLSTTQRFDLNPTNISLSEPLKFFGQEFGNIWGPGIADNVIIYDDSLTSAEVQRDFDLQPWT